ncbi:uncharacterized protein LOC132738632 [Ruditapes philippinarum]|uniref:uncharacterized protein LOC132738632 n=1 Tax=Ruditapes philippinarum TaxID=129788 RepID=UPI00295A5C89|nr:uncharacterized protein LOC132738632 [Ruditapes philippinarum]
MFIDVLGENQTMWKGEGGKLFYDDMRSSVKLSRNHRLVCNVKDWRHCFILCRVSNPDDAGFTTDVNFASDPILTCVAGSVSQSSYVVVVRAKYQSDAGQTDLTITITFTDQSPATGPTWNTGTSHTLDKTDANACNSVTTLSATSTDSSTVQYSIQGSSVFTITGSNILSCTLGDITLSSYTVVVRANQDNNVPTDITLTITVTGLSSGSGGGSSEGESTTEDSDDSWKYGVAFGTVGAVGVTVGGLIFAMKAAKRRDKRRDDKNKKDPALGKSSGSMVTDTNIVKPKEDVKSPLPSTAEKADNALPNGDVAV